MIYVRYSSIDGVSKTRHFKTLKGARRFAQKWVGAHPDLGSSYAVDQWGTGKVEVAGVTLRELFGVDDEILWEERGVEGEAWNSRGGNEAYAAYQAMCCGGAATGHKNGPC